MFAPYEIKELAKTSVKDVFDISKEETYVKTNVILNGIKADVILILILAILSVTLFGRVGIDAIVFLKGISYSLYTILLFKIFGPLWGIIVSFLLVILINMIYIPALIFVVVTFLEINFNLFKVKIQSFNVSMIYKAIFSIIMGFILMFSSVVLEQVLSTVVLNIYSKL